MSIASHPPFDIASGAPPIGAAGARPLSLGHFRRVAVGGFGEGRNSYAYGYAWYDGHAYIGTNRDLLVMARTRFRYEVPCEMWPVEMPGDANLADRGGQIWRYNPTTDTWQNVYRSPLVEGTDGRMVPLAAGFRNLVVFQGKSDPRPALYTVPSCGTFGKGPVMLRSIDGVNFEQITEQGMGLGDPNVTAFRSLVVFRDKLFMTPAGSRGGDPNVSYFASILCTEDPLSGRWERTNVASFGEPTNYGIYDMCVAGDWLYAGTMNIRRGCELWKTRAEGKPPFHWVKVFDRGADRGILNQGVVCVTAFGEDVYLGTGIQNGGYDRVNNVGPDAAEVIRVRPDDSFDIVVGNPRMTRHGLKVPTSGLTAGFGNIFAGYVWRMCAHEGALYVGTYDGTSMLRFSALDDRAKRIFDPVTLEHFIRFRGGCELWRTTDGDHWTPITRNGFGNASNWGIRTLLSTPAGLFVGTANPFGPTMAVRGAGGWHYEPNPEGGIEVWLGSYRHAGARDALLRGAGHDPGQWFGDETDIGEAIGRTLAPLDLLDRQGLDDTGPEHFGEALVEDLWDRAIPDERAATNPASAPPNTTGRALPKHRVADLLARREAEFGESPVARSGALDGDTAAPMGDVPTAVAEYYGPTTMRLVGYWREETWSPAQACRALVGDLLALYPREGAPPAPRVLAVGWGASEMAAEIVRQLSGAVTTALVLHRPADAWRLDAEFDLVVWPDGPSLAGHLGNAIAEVLRQIKPGGWFLGSDLVGPPRDAPRDGDDLVASGGYDHVTTPWLMSRYEEFLLRAGFGSVRVSDITHHGWLRFCRHNRQHFVDKLLFHQCDRQQLADILSALPGGTRLVAAHCVFAAQRRFAGPES